jgi:hypothetical protein
MQLANTDFLGGRGTFPGFLIKITETRKFPRAPGSSSYVIMSALPRKRTFAVQ